MDAGFAVAPLELILIFRGRLPRRAQVEQVHKEVIGQRLWLIGEDAVFRTSKVCTQDAQAAQESYHLTQQLKQGRWQNDLCRL